MIKKHGKLSIEGGVLNAPEWDDAVKNLKDGDYLFTIANTDKNRAMNKLSYLHSVVLRTVAEKLADKTPAGQPLVTPSQLYRYFEDLFAPAHTCIINCKEYEYLDLKSETSAEIGAVTEKIAQYVERKWGIHVPTEEELNTAPYYQMYAEAYMNQWKGYWSEFLSRRKELNKDE